MLTCPKLTPHTRQKHNQKRKKNGADDFDLDTKISGNFIEPVKKKTKTRTNTKPKETRSEIYMNKLFKSTQTKPK